jgi:hypothetical protein
VLSLYVAALRFLRSRAQPYTRSPRCNQVHARRGDVVARVRRLGCVAPRQRLVGVGVPRQPERAARRRQGVPKPQCAALPRRRCQCGQRASGRVGRSAPTLTLTLSTGSAGGPCRYGGTHGVLKGYSRGTQGVLRGYSRILTGYSRGAQGVLKDTHGVLKGYSGGTQGYSRGTQGILRGHRRLRRAGLPAPGAVAVRTSQGNLQPFTQSPVGVLRGYSRGTRGSLPCPSRSSLGQRHPERHHRGVCAMIRYSATCSASSCS